MNDQEIIELFLKNDENAIRETQNKYNYLCKKIIEEVIDNEQDVEECLSDVYFEMWKSIPPNIPKNLKGFIAKIAQNVSYNKLRYNTAKKRKPQFEQIISELDTVIDDNYVFSTRGGDTDISEGLDIFLKSQSYQDRYIFMRRYWFQDSMEDIAKEMHMRASTIRMRLVRLRKRLRRYLINKRYVVISNKK